MKNVKPGHSRPIVCLDAGHYGSRYNAGAVSGYYESAVMWTLHNYLAVELEALGIEVRKTRTTQADMDLIARGKKSTGADLFISLHSNAEKTGKADAPLGIYFIDDNCGAIDEQSKEIAKLLSGVVASTMGTASQGKIWTRSSDYDRDGNGYKDDYYGVLRGAHAVGTTGIIMEHSYHTNAAAAAWLLNVGNLQKLAKAEAKVIADWFGVSKTGGASDSGSVSREESNITMDWLHKGDTGPQVEALQALLKGYIYKDKDGNALSRDGIFGENTDFAVRNFQSCNGLNPDGIVGDNTWAKLLGQ